MRIGVQPYSLHELEEPTPRSLQRIADARFEAVELGASANTDDVHEVLAETGLSVSSMGGDMDVLDDLDAHLEAAEAFDTTDVVVMWSDPERYEDREGVETVAAELDRIADEIADHGLTLHYHNHDHEFSALGDTTGYEYLVEQTDEILFELDLGWAGVGGADPPSLLRDIADRVTHVHVKDMAFETGEFVTFGEGDLDVGASMEACRDAGVEWALYENDSPEDPIAEVSHASLQLDPYTDHVCS